MPVAEAVTRRDFLREPLATAIVFGSGATIGSSAAARPKQANARAPWYRRAYLWGQTNITEKDPVRYDVAWWRRYWKRTHVQAVIINAGGATRTTDWPRGGHQANPNGE